MLPFTLFPSKMDKVAEKFSYAIFWVENIILIVGFMAFEICLIPFVYLITYFNIIFSCKSPLQLVTFLSKWAFGGIFLVFYIMLDDIRHLFKILVLYRGCKEASENNLADEEENEVELDDKQKIKVYNEIRDNVIEMYCEISDKYFKTDEDDDSRVNTTQQDDNDEEAEDQDAEPINWTTYKISERI